MRMKVNERGICHITLDGPWQERAERIVTVFNCVHNRRVSSVALPLPQWSCGDVFANWHACLSVRVYVQLHSKETRSIENALDQKCSSGGCRNNRHARTVQQIHQPASMGTHCPDEVDLIEPNPKQVPNIMQQVADFWHATHCHCYIGRIDVLPYFAWDCRYCLIAVRLILLFLRERVRNCVFVLHLYSAVDQSTKF